MSSRRRSLPPTSLPSKNLPGAKSTAPTAVLSTVALAAIIAVLIVLFGGVAVNIIVGVVVVAYLLAFAGFCYAAVPFASNAVLVPFIAVKMQLHVVYLLLARYLTQEPGSPQGS
ncbi:hypothetical protein PHYSODRAFT_327137 [Phytophthora sojae]|uniref:Uncharacterized protein n=1 Tax=Phytophthora sojae (strain P6497) TaxID=1094619 RepID=G4YY54_PHYSP|nr:hypothetical protein PHYSODRAFT_327137 [Phytophthora sojae]EGZ26222.1 hypothetical protein PHYSODRAFT_327137 [Phytophthora sojae]|eukprot:XP_009521510.1 hypothetical protein PHYSODRAFT_327137 [Phytophthora sojae]